jgi:hypothetical protein
LLLRANWVCFSCVRKKDGASEWKSQPSTLSWTIGIAGPLKPNGMTAHCSAFTLLRTMRLRRAWLPNNRNPGSRSSAFFLRHDRFGADEIAEEFRRWVVFTSKLVRIGARATSTCFLIKPGAEIDADAVRYRLRRNTNMASVIVRRLQAIVRKPVALFGRLVAPKPAVADFLDFFARDRTTILVVATFVIIPAMDEQQRDQRLSLKAWRQTRIAASAAAASFNAMKSSSARTAAGTDWRTHHSVMFSTTSLKSLPFLRVKIH